MNPSPPDYSVNYSSSTRTNDEEIRLPNQPTRLEENDEGIVITPETTSIVIKTRLVKQKHNPFAAPSTSDDLHAPPSLLNISSSSQSQDINSDTKVFINVCTHSIIALPSQRKTIDESGNEIDGWRLPMSMGDLRPFYSKGNAASIAADCILHPSIIDDMRADPAHMQFVLDLIIQCAERKFQNTRFGGRVLERSFKLPKMKYAGYVDERTNLSIVPNSVKEGLHSLSNNNTEEQQTFPPSRTVVAKQRVKGSGGSKTPIIQEIQCNKSDSIESPPPVSEARIELLITSTDTLEMVPLFDFLRNAADNDEYLQKETHRTLQEMIRSPKLKPRKKNLCESQLLTIPVPLRDCQASAIIARCSFQPGLTSQSELPVINVSAFLVTLSKTESNSATECVLPFAVDSQKTSVKYDTKSGAFEIRMPILRSARDFEQNADPGTRQWEIQNAFRRKSNDKGEEKGKAASRPKDVAQDDQETRGASYLDIFDHTLLEEDTSGNDCEDDDSSRPLPEDAFHSQDILSKHLLKKQEEERNAQKQKNISREGAVEHVDYFKPEGMLKNEDETTTRGQDSSLLSKAEEVLKQNLPESCHQISGSHLALGLV
jgi:hypothetical protein